MMRVTFQEKVYEFELKDVLEALTGRETVMVEGYMGGWPNFRHPSHMARSTVVLVWLALRSAGKAAMTLDEIEDIPGLVFGDVWTVHDDEQDDLDGQSPPADTPQTTTAPRLNGPDGLPMLPLRNVSEHVN